MERSSKFISLSGLSGILAGVYALAGAGVVVYAQPWLLHPEAVSSLQVEGMAGGWGSAPSGLVLQLVWIALIVLVAAVATALFLSNRQAKRKGQPMWGLVSRALLYHLAVPLLTGGVLILIMLLYHHYAIVPAASLIFYGLALFSAGNFTFADIKYLGLCELLLGLIAAYFPGYGLLFWILGFGVLHIIYGARIYLKYDR
ncbi:hypothetical protein ACFFOO_16795 [Mucilaginibacter ginsenosidivorans]